MRLHCLQHVWFEDLGMINNWAVDNGLTVTRTALYDGEPLPDSNEIDWLVIMGGPMNIYQDKKYPWLMDEKRFIEQAIQRDKVVLGICLGAQLIAHVLGATVERSSFREIGWFPVKFLTHKTALLKNVPDQCVALHWHEDTFLMPRGAVHLARSAACLNQAFSYNHARVIALQFHLEITRVGIGRLIDACGQSLPNEKYVVYLE